MKSIALIANNGIVFDIKLSDNIHEDSVIKKVLTDYSVNPVEVTRIDNMDPTELKKSIDRLYSYGWACVDLHLETVDMFNEVFYSDMYINVKISPDNDIVGKYATVNFKEFSSLVDLSELHNIDIQDLPYSRDPKVPYVQNGGDTATIHTRIVDMKCGEYVLSRQHLNFKLKSI